MSLATPMAYLLDCRSSFAASSFRLSVADVYAVANRVMLPHCCRPSRSRQKLMVSRRAATFGLWIPHSEIFVTESPMGLN